MFVSVIDSSFHGVNLQTRRRTSSPHEVDRSDGTIPIVVKGLKNERRMEAASV